MFLLCSNELHKYCEHTRTNLCKVVREQLEKAKDLFTLVKLDLDFYSTGILYSSPKVPTYTGHRTLSLIVRSYLVGCKSVKRMKRLSAYKAVIKILFVTYTIKNDSLYAY